MKTLIISVLLSFSALLVQSQQVSTSNNEALVLEVQLSKSLDIDLENSNVYPQASKAALTIFWGSAPAPAIFNHHLFNRQLAATPLLLSGGKLMRTVRETLSYTGQVFISKKKFHYITGMTGKGVGLKVRL